jgi:hypothetical protein
MKKLLPILLLSVLTACTKQKTDVAEPARGTLVLLKVDYLTGQFEGGRAFQFTPSSTAPQSIPVLVDYVLPGDFGSVTLRYQPTGDTILDGTIHWMGKGALRYPQISSPSSFPASGTTIPAPDSTGIQGIYVDPHPPHFNDSMIAVAWSGVAGLSITKQYVQAGAVKGLFLYTPSVGIGNPTDWDYFWLLYR